jgi:hypothetical protein
MPVRAPGSRLEHGFEIVPMGVLEVLMADEAELIVRGAGVHRQAFFAECVRRWAIQVGISPVRTDPGAQQREYELEPVVSSADNRGGSSVEGSTIHTAKERSS